MFLNLEIFKKKLETRDTVIVNRLEDTIKHPDIVSPVSINETSSIPLSNNQIPDKNISSIELSDNIYVNTPTSWLDIARNSTRSRISQDNGSLQVNVQVGSNIIQEAPIELINSTGHVIDSGITDPFGNYTFDIVPIGNYSVVVQQVTNITKSVEIIESVTSMVTANFGRIRITTEDDLGNPVDATVEIRNSNEGTVEAIGLSSGSLGNVTYIVGPRSYDIIAFYGYGQSKPSVIVEEGLLANAHFVFGSIQGKFGSIEVHSLGFFDMPLTTSVIIKNYTNGLNVASGATYATTGKRSWLLAPDIYRVEIRESNLVINESIVVTENVQTNISVEWGVLIVYQDNTTNSYVEVYDDTNSVLISYAWIAGNTQLVTFTLEQGNYSIHYSGQIHPVTIIKGNRTLINQQINTSPTRLSVTASHERINADEQTNITVTLSDVNFDYKNIQFSWIPNVGSVTGIDQQNSFIQENEYGSTISYTAPSSLQTMYIDITVSDAYDGNFSYRIYVSNRQGTVYVNSTELGGIGKQSTYIELVRANTGVIAGSWSNSTGWVTFSNYWEDEYFLRAYEDNTQTSLIFHLDPDQNYSYNFMWGLLKINSTGLNGQLIDSSIYVYNQTTDEHYRTLTTSTSDNGYAVFFLKKGSYKVRAHENNDIWLHNLTVLNHLETFYEFKFSVFAIYYLDENGLPKSTYAEVINRTTGIMSCYGYTTPAGLLILIVAPYDNYSISVYHNSSFSYLYELLSISPNEGQNIGQFVNHKPIITGYSASPSIVSPTNSTIIIVTAEDPDPLDILTFVYLPSMGSIVGSGNNVTYQAPAIDGFYYLNISVVDPHGEYDNITRSLSARTAIVSVNITDFEDIPLTGHYLELIDWSTGGIRSGWSNLSGYVVFSDVPESFYYLKAYADNIMLSEVFISGNAHYDYAFKFGTLFVNSTGGNHDLIVTEVAIIPTGTSTIERTKNTVITGNGQVRYNLRPDFYDIRGRESNYLYFQDIEINDDLNVNLTFKWAEFNITTRTAQNMPLSSYWELYNRSTSTLITYGWAPITTGQVTTYASPGTDYQIRIYENNMISIDTIGIENEVTHVEGKFGILRVSQSDKDGNPFSVSITVRNSTTDTNIVSQGTGVDGVCYFLLKEGIYKVFNTTIVISNVSVNKLKITRLEFGFPINNDPSIISVTSSPTRIGPSSSTFILIQVTDIDFDYDFMDTDIITSVGTLGEPEIGWIQKDLWFYRIEYFSPSSSEIYKLNITITDGRGGTDHFMLIVSDRTGTFQIESQGNAFRGLITSIYIYRDSTGELIYSGNTDGTGTLTRVLVEDYYNIRARMNNDYWVMNTWLRGGDIIDINILWGELTVYSTGIGGEPIQGTYVEVYDQITGVLYSYAWTDVAGKVHFILAPGLYRIILTESTSIIFENLLIIGGATLALGSEIPSVNHPADLMYPENSVGNTITWILIDTNPAFYYVSLDGTTFLVNVTTWLNDTEVIVSIDNLPLGEHYVVLFANDTSGYEQYDIVLIQVTPAINAPIILSPINDDYIRPSIPIVVENTTIIEESWYQFFIDSSWSTNTSLNWNGSYWEADLGWNAGNYILRVFFKDSYGFERYSEVRFNIEPLLLSLFFPLNNSVIQSSSLILVEWTGAASLDYNWDDEGNISYVLDDSGEFRPLPSLSEGSHRLNVYIHDVAGNSLQQIYFFTIDDTPPSIESYDDLEDGSEVGAGTTIPFSIADLHFEEFTYYWNNSEESTDPVTSDVPWVTVPTGIGTWTLNMYATDEAGNFQEETLTVVVLNSVSLILLYPNGGEIVGGYVTIQWSSPDALTVDVFYSPDAGYSWVKLIGDITTDFYIWDTAQEPLNGSSFLVRIVSKTTGKPGEVRSESVFTILNIVTRDLPIGLSEIDIPDINVSITVSSATNVTIQRVTEVTPIMDPNASGLIPFGLYVDIVLGDLEALEILIVTFNVSYLRDALAAQNMTIFDLEVFFYNESSHFWEPADDTDYNDTLSIVIGTFNHTTTIGALGRAERPSIAEGEFPFFFILLIVLILGGAAGGALLIYDHQQHALSGTTSILSQIQTALGDIYTNIQKKIEGDG